jgi:hypothetical protein
VAALIRNELTLKKQVAAGYAKSALQSDKHSGFTHIAPRGINLAVSQHETGPALLGLAGFVRLAS